jgi:hypothetical protein
MKAYEKAGRVVRLAGWFELAGAAIILATVVAPSIAHGSAAREGFGIAMLVIAVFAVFQLFLGKAIQDHKDWARKTGIVLYAIQLLGFPIWTLISIYVLWGLIKGWAAASE